MGHIDSAHPRRIASIELLLQEVQLMLLDVQVSHVSPPVVANTLHAFILAFQGGESLPCFLKVALRLQEILHSNEHP